MSFVQPSFLYLPNQPPLSQLRMQLSLLYCLILSCQCVCVHCGHGYFFVAALDASLQSTHDPSAQALQSSLCEIGQPASVGANKYLPESISCVFLSLSSQFSPVPQLSPPGQIRVPVHTASSSAHTTPKTPVFTWTTSHTFP